MRRLGWVSLAIGGLAAVTAVGAELPSRKPGLWAVRMISDNRGPGLVVQQCIDKATDQMLQSSAGPISIAACTKRDVQRSEDAILIDSACTVDGKIATSHAIITGNLDSAYTMTVTTKSEALQVGLNMTVTGRWLGPCQPDQKPGDVIMPSGAKINVPDLQKRPPSNLPLPR